ncbi:MAG: RNA methyltransferase [Phycisphaerae bacterium]|nr:MAG: class I SAM-dependent RNA methyltransferase [Planctomycetia bacterium]RIK71377.1 MAG: RNA methyltransferase [Planctomycetota bacterium]GJQ26498.1 MAG: RNA methyltransferase [Phycisphaerae bacterium]
MALSLDEKREIRVTCALRIPSYLRDEIEALGYQLIDEGRAYVELFGTLRDAMRLNLHLRTAQHVLYLLNRFDCDGPDQLYRAVNGLPWETIVAADGYLTVSSSVNHPTINSWAFASLKVKDAIVDRIADKMGRRPDSGPDRSGVVVHLEWHGDQAAVYLNTSGNKLSDRGYRRIPHKAPMAETLAAAVLMAAGYDGSGVLVNPMCGSGTLAIEAALMATGRAPGLLRSDYGLLHVLGMDKEAWQAARREAGKARAASKRRGAGPTKARASDSIIIASDLDPAALAAAKQNAKTAGVDHMIEFAQCDFAETRVPELGECPGMVLLNPEYGERMGDEKALEATYARIGDFFKQKCAGYTGFIFTGNRNLVKHVGLRASRRIEFWNARIDCRLMRYEMYRGTREAYGTSGQLKPGDSKSRPSEPRA